MPGRPLLLALALFPLGLVAGSLVLPYTFSNGTVADATAVNANFDELADQVNALEDGAAGVWAKAGSVATFAGDVNVTGTVKQGSVPAFRARVGGTGQVTATNGEVLPFALEEFDVAGNYDPATGTFTAPFAGIYWFSTNTAFFASNTAGRRYIAFHVGSALNLYADFNPTTAAVSDRWDLTPLTGLIKLEAGQTVTVRYSSIRTGDAYWQGAQSPVGHFMGYLVTRL